VAQVLGPKTVRPAAIRSSEADAVRDLASQSLPVENEQSHHPGSGDETEGQRDLGRAGCQVRAPALPQRDCDRFPQERRRLSRRAGAGAGDSTRLMPTIDAACARP
jgi:hypothetical protein